MKRLAIMVILIWAHVAVLAAQSAKDSILQYFPSSKGNIWKYELAGNPKRSVFVRSAGPSTYNHSAGWYDFYRTPHKAGESAISTLNIDTALMIVSRKSTFSAYEVNLASKPGDKFYSDGMCDSIRTDTVLGLPTTVKYFSRKGYEWNRQYKYAWKIGLIEGSDGSEFYDFSLNTSYRLTYAKIDGHSYGQLLTPGETDSLAKFYPFHIGNVWIYNETTVIPWQAPKVRFVRKEVVSDTLIDGNEYSVVLTTDSKNGPTSLQFFRFDSASANVYSKAAGGNESLFDSLSVGEMTGYLSLKGAATDTVLGMIVPVRNILEHVNIDYVQNRSTAWGVGLTGYGSEDYNGMSVTAVLAYAKINGKELGVLPTSVAVRGQAQPASFRLDQNYPNPFNPSTTISFAIPVRSFVSLKIFDVMGKEVAVLVAGECPAGIHLRRWDAARFASGMYYYRLQAGTHTETRKLVVTK